MFSTIIRFTVASLIPNRSFLKTRLSPVSAYMGTTILLALVASIIDSVYGTGRFASVPWPIRPFIGPCITPLLWFAHVAFVVHLLVRLILPKPWTYRHAFPYAVAANVISVPVAILIFQLQGTGAAATSLLIICAVYSSLPLLLGRKKRRT